MSTFGKRLKYLREKNKISREDFAQKVGVSYWSVSKYETDSRTPDPETISRIADLFDVSVDYLMLRTDDPSPHNNEEKTMKEFLEQPALYWDEGIPAHPEGVKMFKELLEMAKAKAREELRKQREAEEKEQEKAE